MRHWLIWQLVDSAFPTGGFAHSSGLESAKQGGLVPDERALSEFVSSSLSQLVSASLPYTAATHAAPDSLWVVDAHCDAFLANPIVNRASRAQGDGLLSAASKAFASERLVDLKLQARAGQHPLHYAPVFGAVLGELGVELPEVIRMFLYLSIRDILSAAIRLNIVGPLRSQRLLRELATQAEQLAQAGVSSDYRCVAQVSPVLDMWQSSHDRLYSRLFQS